MYITNSISRVASESMMSFLLHRISALEALLCYKEFGKHRKMWLPPVLGIGTVLAEVLIFPEI
jgi:hypothetical protein